MGAVGWGLKGEEQMYWGEMLEGVQGKGYDGEEESEWRNTEL